MLLYKKVFNFSEQFFVTKFVTRITKFLTCVTKFVTLVTNFVIKIILWDRKKYQGENEKCII